MGGVVRGGDIIRRGGGSGDGKKGSNQLFFTSFYTGCDAVETFF